MKKEVHLNNKAFKEKHKEFYKIDQKCENLSSTVKKLKSEANTLKSENSNLKRQKRSLNPSFSTISSFPKSIPTDSILFTKPSNVDCPSKNKAHPKTCPADLESLITFQSSSMSVATPTPSMISHWIPITCNTKSNGSTLSMVTHCSRLPALGGTKVLTVEDIEFLEMMDRAIKKAMSDNAFK